MPHDDHFDDLFEKLGLHGSDLKVRDKIAEKMTLQQIAEAQKLARECQDRNFRECD